MHYLTSSLWVDQQWDGTPVPFLGSDGLALGGGLGGLGYSSLNGMYPKPSPLGGAPRASVSSLSYTIPSLHSSTLPFAHPPLSCTLPSLLSHTLPSPHPRLSYTLPSLNPQLSRPLILTSPLLSIFHTLPSPHLHLSYPPDLTGTAPPPRATDIPSPRSSFFHSRLTPPASPRLHPWRAQQPLLERTPTPSLPDSPPPFPLLHIAPIMSVSLSFVSPITVVSQLRGCVPSGKDVCWGRLPSLVC